MDDLSSPEARALEKAMGSGVLLDALPIGVYCCDPAGVLRHFNKSAAKLWGRTPALGDTEQRFCGAHKLFLLDGTPLHHAQTPMVEVLRTAKPVRDQHVVIERPDGTRVIALVNIDPLFDENGVFVGAVNMFSDVTDRHKAEIELAHLAAIVSSSSDAIVSKALDGTIRSWNQGAARIFGYQPEEMVGQPITRIIPAELHGEEAEILARLRRGERIEHFETERVTKDGRRINVSLTVSPVHDRTGRIVGASKVARDITDRKRAEKLQRLLISELNHRVKNTLATVQSIANQTVRLARSPTEFAASFSGRIHALAHTHDLLTRNSWQGADIMQLVREQVLLNSIEDERISLSGPLLTLDPQLTLHLALILHELGTNARKYGSLSVVEGRLSVSWTVTAGQPNQFLLQWRESGGPMVNVPTRRGFGTTLMERSLAAHGGQATIQYRAEGVHCEILLPLSERLRSGGQAITQIKATTSSLTGHPNGNNSIEGKKVLVVEDEALVALEIGAILSEAGCVVVGPAATMERAKLLIENESFDAALLDANLDGRPVDEVAALLTRMNIPFAFLTGYEREALPEAFRQALMVNKPFTREEAVDLVRRLTEERHSVVRIRKKN